MQKGCPNDGRLFFHVNCWAFECHGWSQLAGAQNMMCVCFARHRGHKALSNLAPLTRFTSDGRTFYIYRTRKQTHWHQWPDNVQRQWSLQGPFRWHPLALLRLLHCFLYSLFILTFSLSSWCLRSYSSPVLPLSSYLYISSLQRSFRVNIDWRHQILNLPAGLLQSIASRPFSDVSQVRW